MVPHPVFHHRWFWLCLLLWGVVSQAVDSFGFRVINARTQLVNGVYRLQARMDLVMSPETLEALTSGVPLTFVVDMEVSRHRHWLWNTTVAQLEQRYRLEYHSLTDLFLVTNLTTGIQDSHYNLESALKELGRIDGFPLLDHRLLANRERYQAQLRVRLDVEALPAPLRVSAYVSPEWRLTSPWYNWPLSLQ